MNIKILPVICFLVLSAVCELPGATIDPDNRWQVRDYFNTVYPYGSDLKMEWTGDYATGDAGDVSTDWREATLVHVNFFREMAGVPSNVIFDSGLNEKCQQSSLMMSVNDSLSHTPPESWLNWTQGGYDAANNGNIALGSAGVESIENYMSDFGVSNGVVGHRRWILYPTTTVMGSGDVPGTDPFLQPAANTLWVIPESFTDRPETRDEFIAWPPRGFVPSELVYARWSFSYPEADFSGATVTMVSEGKSIPLKIDSRQNGFGDNTIVWIPNDMSILSLVRWPVPTPDQSVEVTIGAVLIDGLERSIQYTVKIFDSTDPGAEEFTSRGYAMGPILVDYPGEFTISSRPFAEGAQGRIIGVEPYTAILGAEDGTLPFEAHTSGEYSIIQSGRKANGSSAYHLANPDATDQILTHLETFIVMDGEPELSFNSSLAWATASQVASVEINASSGENWREIWRLTGPVDSNTAFTSETIDLGGWIGQSVRLRFRYYLEGMGSYYPQTDSSVGWVIDDIRLDGVERVDSVEELPVRLGTNSMLLTFDSVEPVYLQTRDIAFGGFPLDWGPIVQIDPVSYNGIENDATNVWSKDPVFGYNCRLSGEWLYSPVLRWISMDSFPWIFTTSGWFRYVSGSVDTRLWLYSPQWGFVYTNSEMKEQFRYAPFTPESTASFGD